MSHTVSLPSKGQGSCDVSASALSSGLLCPCGQMQVAIGVDRRFLQAVTSGKHQREVGGWLTLPAILCASLYLTHYIFMLEQSKYFVGFMENIRMSPIPNVKIRSAEYFIFQH